MTIQTPISWFKVLLIKIIDLLDYQPWEEFTRPVQEKYPELLKDKALKFNTNLNAEFFLFGNALFQYKMPVPKTDPPIVDMGDQALWHGIATAMFALKYSVTKDQNDYLSLAGCYQGLNMHQRFPAEKPVRRLVRGVDNLDQFQDDVSNDQLSGHLCGIYFAWKYGDTTLKDSARILIQGIADELIAHSDSLINSDGTVTSFGQLENGYLTDPLRITLLLAVIKFAMVTTDVNDSRLAQYSVHYNHLIDEYYPLIKYPKVRFWTFDTQYDTHRAAIHLSILADVANDYNVSHRCCEGLRRIWKMIRPSANPWVYFLVRRQINTDPEDLENVLKHLKEFTLEDKNLVTEKINSNDGTIRTTTWGGTLRARQPIPRWRAGSQDFFWQRHLYSVDDWIGQVSTGITHSGLDFLIAYWGLRNINLINGEI